MGRKMVWIGTIAVMVALVLAAGCGPGANSEQQPRLTFETAMEIGAEQAGQELHVSLGVRNAGEEPFDGDRSFDGRMELRRASGELRASAEVIPLQSLEPGETAWPLNWRGDLEPGSYELTWGAEGYGFTTVEFTVVERGGWLYLAGDVPTSPPAEGQPSEETDALVAQAIADLGRRLGVGPDAITVESVEPTEFPDASLGVPEPGTSYAQVITPGYVIRLAAGDELYEYHAGGGRVVLASGEPADGGAYQRVTLSEIGLTFEVPARWQQRGPEPVWSPDEGEEARLGVNWMELRPPLEPEAALLPGPAQVLEAEPVDLGWAEGRRFTLERFGPAAPDEDEDDETRAPVEAVETHVLVVVERGGERLGLDFYAGAPTAEELAGLEPALQHLLDTAALAGPAEAEDEPLPVAGPEVATWHTFRDGNNSA